MRKILLTIFSSFLIILSSLNAQEFDWKIQKINSSSTPGQTSTTYTIIGISAFGEKQIPSIYYRDTLGEIIGNSFEYLWILDDNRFISTNSPYVNLENGVSPSIVFTSEIYNGPPPPNAMINYNLTTPSISRTEFNSLINADDPIEEPPTGPGLSSGFQFYIHHNETYKNDTFQVLTIITETNKVNDLFIYMDSDIRSNGVDSIPINLKLDQIIGRTIHEYAVSTINNYTDHAYRKKISIPSVGNNSQNQLHIVFKLDEMPELVFDSTSFFQHFLRITNFELTQNHDEPAINPTSNIIDIKIPLTIVAGHDPNQMSMKICECGNSDNSYNTAGNIRFTNDGSGAYEGPITVTIPFPEEYDIESLHFTETTVPHFPNPPEITIDTVERTAMVLFRPSGSGFPASNDSVTFTAKVYWTINTKPNTNICDLTEFHGITSFGDNFHWKTNTTKPVIMSYCDNQENSICHGAQNCNSGWNYFCFLWRSLWGCGPCD